MLQAAADGPVDDQLDLEAAEVAAVVEVEVDAYTVPLGEVEDRVELPDRVTVDGRRVQPTEGVDLAAGGLVEQLEHARAAQQDVLRKRDHGQLDGGSERIGGVPDDVESPQAQPRVHVHVRPDRRRAVPEELPQYCDGAVEVGEAESVATAAFVRDPRRGAGVTLER